MGKAGLCGKALKAAHLAYVKECARKEFGINCKGMTLEEIQLACMVKRPDLYQKHN